MKNLPLCLIFLMIFVFCACTSVQNDSLMPKSQVAKGYEPTAEEVYTWFPPSQEKLKARKIRQKQLDAIEGEMSKLYLNHENNLQLVDEFGNELDPWSPAVSNWEGRFQQQIVIEEKKSEALAGSLDSLKKEKAVVDKKFAAMQTVKRETVFSYDDYKVAVGLFRDGKYDDSINTFKKVLSKNPPLPLMDNIHFAISSSYYHLKKYKEAITHLDQIINKYPEGDKWHMSYIMLGLIYNTLGQKSQAVYGLEEVLKKNPPTDIIRLVNRLRKLIDVVPAES
jgi:TolA-binding protein